MNIVKKSIIYFSRNKLSTFCVHCSKSKTDPGIRERLKILADHKQIQEESDLDEHETDFMKLNKSYSQHKTEIEEFKEKEKSHIVRQKYFKVVYPNFLTWHDKEQIQFLYRTDPEEWTIDKLSEGFPALPETILKIVKSNWKKSNTNKIRNHDTSVQQNWIKFKANEIPDLPTSLIEHLNKFTNRELNLHPFQSPNETFLNKPEVNVKSEFAEIITSYGKLKKIDTLNKSSTMVTKTVTEYQPKGDTYIPEYQNSSKNKELITFEALQAKLKKDVVKGNLLSVEENLIAGSTQHGLTAKSGSSETELCKNKYSQNEVSLEKKAEKSVSHLIYPESIRIPSGKVKRDCLYKLNDCYYDSDGKFLYRVPGMY